MLEHNFKEVYLKFKMNFYRSVFTKFETREASLTAVETFCTEIIHALRSPTINEFAQYTGISAQNATHRVNSLVRKGYVTKSQSPDDRREYRLTVTDKFYLYYNVSDSYINEVLGRLKKRLPNEDIEIFTRVLNTISSELMPEAEQITVNNEQLTVNNEL